MKERNDVQSLDYRALPQAVDLLHQTASLLSCISHNAEWQAMHGRQRQGRTDSLRRGINRRQARSIDHWLWRPAHHYPEIHHDDAGRPIRLRQTTGANEIPERQRRDYIIPNTTTDRTGHDRT